MVKPKLFQISISKSVYYEGEIVQGHVKLEIDEDMKYEAITIKFEGFARVNWTEITTPFYGLENYFKEELNLLSSGTTGSDILPTGTYQYPFHFQLPQNLPSTYQDQIGQVKYHIKCKLKRKWKCDELFCPFDIALSNPVSSQAPGASKGPDTLKFLYSNTIGAILRLDKTEFTPGDVIPLFAEICSGVNDSQMTICVTLVQSIQYHASCGHKWEKIRNITYNPENADRWNGGSLRIPNDLSPNLYHCKLINIAYKLKLEVKPCNLKIETDIIIVPRPAQSVSSESELSASGESQPTAPALPPPAYEDVMSALEVYQVNSS